ncbi:hypothetical protein KP803_14200 [Vibrio sp. ZSDE26]|uniref:C-type lysozyme inhibitor domain-containing protein n=1 Tax=Vibrio amylolyticus TaxID=2847292 RepID=A0A9X1XRV4_9VIBR|nr:hypothetical protein [Vibrio amylolyticus]MCK6264429.1 hypothetical protein [Vibrio amylolyticus]
MKFVKTWLVWALFCSGHSIASNLCFETEIDEFSCQFSNKQVSVCSLGERQFYRFGTQSKIELEIESKDTIEYYSFSGGGERVITFLNGDYSYVINSRTTRSEYVLGGWVSERTANLVVNKGEQELVSLECEEF